MWPRRRRRQAGVSESLTETAAEARLQTDSSSKNTTLLVYAYPALAGLKPTQTRSGTLVEYDVGARRFTEFDGVILPYDAFVVKTTQAGIVSTILRDERERRAKEITVLLDNGGIVCWLMDKVPSVAIQASHQSFPAWAYDNWTHLNATYPAFSTLYFTAGLIPGPSMETAVTRLVSKRSEFADWIRSHSSTRHLLWPIERQPVDTRCVVCTTLTDDPVGVAIRQARGSVVVLPYVPANRPPPDLAQALTELADALVRYRRNTLAAPPAWVDEFQFGEEAIIRQRLATLERESGELRSQLQPYEADKGLLHLSGDDLVSQVLESLARRGIRTHHDERYVEDFELLDGEGRRIALCEVKGLEHNVGGGPVGQINLHRAHKDIGYEELPGLLIANTFRNASALKDKDRPVEPKTRKQAAHFNVLIVRTLDLLRLFGRLDTGKITADELLHVLTAHAGWLSVSPSGEPTLLTD